MKSTSSTLSVINHTSFKSNNVLTSVHYRLCNALQTSLDFSELIDIFSNHLQSFVPHNSFSYHNTTFNLAINKGITSQHTCTYTLKLEEFTLGELKLMRHYPFDTEETTLLETLLCTLLYPLKNATLYKQALNMAFTDPLTKAYNRASFDDTLRREINLANRKSNHLSLIFLDIDHFKMINDDYGHKCGDIALIAVVNSIKETLRNTDVVFRYGGEEFVVLLNDTGIDSAQIIAERIRQNIAIQNIPYGVNIIKFTISLGISSLRGNDSPDSLVKRADIAMYQAKKQGRNQVQIEKSVSLTND